MLASPCSDVYRDTRFCKLFFEVIGIFGVGITVEMVHNLFHRDGTYGLVNGRGRGSMGHLLIIIYHC